MKHKKNKALKKYLHDVKKDCHGNYKSKKLFIEQLKDSLTTYTEEIVSMVSKITNITKVFRFVKRR